MGTIQKKNSSKETASILATMACTSNHDECNKLIEAKNAKDVLHVCFGPYMN